MPEDYYGFCERLWQDWLLGPLDVSPFISTTFDLVGSNQLPGKTGLSLLADALRSRIGAAG